MVSLCANFLDRSGICFSPLLQKPGRGSVYLLASCLRSPRTSSVNDVIGESSATFDSPSFIMERLTSSSSSFHVQHGEETCQQPAQEQSFLCSSVKKSIIEHDQRIFEKVRKICQRQWKWIFMRCTFIFFETDEEPNATFLFQGTWQIGSFPTLLQPSLLRGDWRNFLSLCSWASSFLSCSWASNVVPWQILKEPHNLESSPILIIYKIMHTLDAVLPTKCSS